MISSKQQFCFTQLKLPGAGENQQDAFLSPGVYPLWQDGQYSSKQYSIARQIPVKAKKTKKNK